MAVYPEEHLYEKSPRRPRHNQGMTQPMRGKVPPKTSQPRAGRIMHGKALVMALKGVANKRHPHDGSK